MNISFYLGVVGAENDNLDNIFRHTRHKETIFWDAMLIIQKGPNLSLYHKLIANFVY